MHDLRRQALESHKTISKKAQARMSTSSRNSSAPTSKSQSRTASRNPSDDEEGGGSDSTNWRSVSGKRKRKANIDSPSANSIDDADADVLEDTSLAWQQDLDNRIEEIIDTKRSSSQGRESMLAQYNHILMCHYAYEEMETKTSELFSALIKTVKSEPSEKETLLALRAIALTLMTIPSESVYDVIFQVLNRRLIDSEFNSVKALVIHTLSVAAIYGGASDTEIEEIMDELLEIIESDGETVGAGDSGEVVTAACQVWGFLATYIDNIRDKNETAMEAFIEQLDSSDMSVQIAAGENIALLYERSFTPREASDGPQPFEWDEDGQPVDTSIVKRYDAYPHKEQLEHKLNKLANDPTRRISKEDRKTLHASFADIRNTVEYPFRGPKYQKAISWKTGLRFGSRLTIRVHKTGSMKINKWWKMHRLQALRRIIGGGFIHHYEANPVVFETLPIMVMKS